jgi:hypothetical protein
MLTLIIVVLTQIGIHYKHNSTIYTTIIGKDQIVIIIIDLTIAIHPEVKDGMHLVVIIGIIKGNLLSHMLGF